MTLPNGVDGLSDLLGLAFPISTGDGSVSTQKDNDRPTVEALLKGRMKDSAGWQSASGAAFAGLPGGIPLILGIVTKLAEQFTGIDVTHFLDQWNENPVVDGLEHIMGEAFGAIFTVSANIQSLFGSLNFLDPDWDPEEMLGIWINVITSGFGLLGPNSPLNAKNLFGLLLPGIFGSVPLGTITNERPNLLPAGNYVVGSLTAGSEWSIDPTSTRTADGSGSVKVVADGRAHALRSGRNPTDRIAVSKGQSIAVATNVSYEGYSGSGETILLQVVPFLGDVQGDTVQVAAYAPPNGNLAWPGYEMSGEYVVPNGVTAIQTRKMVTDQALAGTIRFDDDDTGQSGKFHIEWIDGLPDSLEQGAARWQGMLDTFVNVFQGTDSLGHALEELADAIVNIPGDFVQGVLGPGTIAGDALSILNHLVGGWVDTPDGTGASLADVFNVGKWVSAGSSLGRAAFDLLGFRANTSVSSGLLPTGRSNIPLSQVRSKASPAFAAVAPGSTAVASDRIEVSQPLGVVRWMGYNTSGITSFYFNAWLVEANGSKTLKHHSADIKSVLDPTATSANPKMMAYELPVPLATNMGEQYVYEWVAVGGTHYIVADQQGTWAPDDPHAVLDAYGYTRNETTPATPASTQAKANFVSTNVVPWVEVAIDLGDTTGYHEPLDIYRTESGSITVPSWVNDIYGIALSRSSDGAAGGLLGFEGDHGSPGTWTTVHWQRGVDFTGDIVISYTCGPNVDTAISIPGSSITTTKPANGSGTHFGHTASSGVNPIEFHAKRYGGGGGQNVAGGAGIAPGGAGAGGRSNILFGGPGGKGAAGAVWLELVQGAPVGAPTPGTVSMTGIASAQAFGSHTVSSAGVSGELPLPDRNAIDAIFAAEMAVNKQPGTGISLWSPKGTYTKMYGKTAVDGRALSNDDSMAIGSITKTFTAWAFMREIDKGNVDWDDVLEDHFPGFPNGTIMTMRHIMSMQSGLYDFQNDDLLTKIRFGFLTPMAPYDMNSAFSSMKRNAARFIPGTAYQYNNGNYVMMGFIIEKYNPGRTIKQVLEQDIIAPLGLTRTVWPPIGPPPPPAAGEGKTNTTFYGASGAIASTLGDMLKWGMELRDGTLLDSATHDEWLSYEASHPYAGEGPSTFGYGYGKVSLGSFEGHDGALTAGGSNLMFEPATGTVIFTFENKPSPGLGAVARLFYRTAEYLYPGSANIEDYGVTRNVGLTGIPSGEAFGELRNIPDGTIGLTGIPSPAAFGTLTAVPPTPVVVFDNFAYAAVGFKNTLTVSINTAPGAKVLIAAFAASAGVTDVTCTGGTATLIDKSSNLSVYKIIFESGDPGGTKAVVGTSRSGCGWSACVWSHTGATTVALAAKQEGSDTGLSFGPVAVTPGAGQKILQVWAVFNYSASGALLSSPAGGTVRMTPITDGNRTGMQANETYVTTTFTATASPNYYSGYGTIAVVLS